MATSDGGLNTQTKIGPDRDPVRSLACAEVWGGNNIVDLTVEVPGFIGWVHSEPLQPATMGGDVITWQSAPRVCFRGCLSRRCRPRAGCQRDRGGAAQFCCEAHECLGSEHSHARNERGFPSRRHPAGVQYATAAVFGYFWKNSELVFTNAGHPSALWYHATEKTWDWLHDETPYNQTTIEGVPLGLIPGTEYSQGAVRLGEGDLLILYPDGISESTSEDGKELGCDGLLQLARSLPLQTTKSPSAAGQALLQQ